MTGPEEQLRHALRTAAEHTAATPPSAHALLRAHRRHAYLRNTAVGATLAAVRVGAWEVSDLVLGNGSNGRDAERLRPAGTRAPSSRAEINPACEHAHMRTRGCE